ncbi:DUF2779 domain-containing protein [Sphingomonas sp. LHG3406-1]|uniref:DUF2779 domain-containing protein n=1 Tax=Sphingomonas sp. LHG3406-1 TaxID=2804617 RepID=UPI0026085EDA|nr:DUF2779 domain-containing protein [Sphingomonas sp. LHG3406-1]
MPNFGLSKSKVAAFEQCPKRLWLQVHKPEEGVIDTAMQARFDIGHAVGELACEAYPNGIMIEAEPDLSAAITLTQELLSSGIRRPLFEATFLHEQVLVRVDIMYPAEGGGWHVAEVKSSASAKEYQLSDLATQVWVMQGCGVEVASASIRHIDSSFVYQGDENYAGLLKDAPADDIIAPLLPTRSELAREAISTLAGEEPAKEPGTHCNSPFSCQFQAYCSRGRAQPTWPISLLPNTGGRLAEAFHKLGIVELLDVPASELKSELHRLIQKVTAEGSPFHDCEKARRATEHWPRPLSYLDFETIAFAIPRWIDTRPFENVPFQFSLHIDHDGVVEHHCFLDLSGDDPRRACAEALIAMLPPQGAIVAYNASFERRCIRQLAETFPDLSQALCGLEARVVDLLPVARACWYHPEQRGSWSIKHVLPTLVPELSYKLLEIGDGGAAQSAYIEAVAPETSAQRRQELASALTAYCSLDTEGLRQVFHRLVDPNESEAGGEGTHA